MRLAALGLAILLAPGPGAAQTAEPSVRALLERARAQTDQKNFAGALASLDRARSLAPNSEGVLLARAELLLATGRPQQAVLDLEPLARLAPKVARYASLLGTALFQVGDARGAVEPLQHAEQLDANDAATLRALGRALNEVERYAEARPRLALSLELAPDDAAAVAALAESEAGLGNDAQAEAQAQRALARDGQSATANLVVGILRMKQERYKEAREALERALAAEPDSARICEQLSRVHSNLHDEASAQKLLALSRRKLTLARKRVEQTRAQAGLPLAGDP